MDKNIKEDKILKAEIKAKKFNLERFVKKAREARKTFRDEDLSRLETPTVSQ